MLKSRNLRTVILALLATFTFVGAAITVFDVEPGLMLSFFIACVLCLLVIVFAAFLLSLLRRFLKR